MDTFYWAGPLEGNDPRFRGREPEIKKLLDLCLGEEKPYGMVYGGRKTGKSSLLNRLAARLPPQLPVCKVNLMRVPDASIEHTYRYIARRVLDAVKVTGGVNPSALPDVTNICEVDDLLNFLSCVVAITQHNRLVMLIQEIGAIAPSAQPQLAKALRAIYEDRNTTHPPLHRLSIIVAGSVELYDLAVAEVSPLHGVCEKVYLPDLEHDQAVGIVAEGLVNRLERNQAEAMGERIYDHVCGHPCLTQLLGGRVEEAVAHGEDATPEVVNATVELLLKDNPVIASMQHALNDRLLPMARSVLAGKARFSRNNESLARLELMGLIKDVKGMFAVRNELFKRWLADVLSTQNTTPNQTIRIFVSATSKDLGDARRAVAQSLEALNDVKVIVMDKFTSHPTQPSETSTDQVQLCNVYVGLFGNCYGTGITAEEYEAAVLFRKPRLIFRTKSSLSPGRVDTTEPVEDQQALMRLKQKLDRDNSWSVFESIDDLIPQVLSSVHNFLKE